MQPVAKLLWTPVYYYQLYFVHRLSKYRHSQVLMQHVSAIGFCQQSQKEIQYNTHQLTLHASDI